MLGLEMKTPLPSAMLFIDHHAASPPLWYVLFAVECLTLWSEVVILVYHTPTCLSSGKQPSYCLSVAF